MKIAPRSKFLLIGDSVTDMGRKQPVGEGLFNPHGNGYPNVVQGLLTSVYPDYFINVVNMGVSGNNVTNLEERWQTDVMDLRPDWVSVMIGVNDVWRQFDIPQIPEAGILPERYRETLARLVDRTKPVVKGMVLMTPVYWEPSTADAMSARVRQYGAICREIAEEKGILFCDAQAYADRVLAHCHSCYIAWDRVHPNIPGANVLAHALLDTIEDLGNATNHALRTLGFPERQRDEYYKLVGRGITNLFKGAVPAGCDTPETIDRMRELFLAHYGVHLCDRTHPYPGIPELLEHITARGIRIAVASNKYQEGAETVIGHFFGRAQEAGQALGQKNTAFAIWLGITYLNPLSSVGPGCYILWQNIINSFEIWQERQKNKGLKTLS